MSSQQKVKILPNYENLWMPNNNEQHKQLNFQKIHITVCNCVLTRLNIFYFHLFLIYKKFTFIKYKSFCIQYFELFEALKHINNEGNSSKYVILYPICYKTCKRRIQSQKQKLSGQLNTWRCLHCQVNRLCNNDFMLNCVKLGQIQRKLLDANCY